MFFESNSKILMTSPTIPEKTTDKKSIKEFGYRIIQIEVTNRCNMGCSFCGLPIRDAKLKDMELDDILNVLEQIAGYEG